MTEEAAPERGLKTLLFLILQIGRADGAGNVVLTEAARQEKSRSVRKEVFGETPKTAGDQPSLKLRPGKRPRSRTELNRQQQALDFL